MLLVFGSVAFFPFYERHFVCFLFTCPIGTRRATTFSLTLRRVSVPTFLCGDFNEVFDPLSTAMVFRWTVHATPPQPCRICSRSGVCPMYGVSFIWPFLVLPGIARMDPVPLESISLVSIFPGYRRFLL